jgi:cob(I)alamin adenosyltransferase
MNAKKFAVVKDTPYVRDMTTQAILNTDRTVIRKHEKKMADLEKEENREKELNILKNEMAEIKSLLKQLVNNSH